MPAPIALVAYARPLHLTRTIDALLRNPEARVTVLYVFCDAARGPATYQAVEDVRRVARRVRGFARVHVVCRDQNLGLARNITGAVTDVLTRHEEVIVVEDDIVVSPYFLRFMNEALDLYRDEPQVGSVSGYCLPVDRRLPETFFIKGADCWGWATWRDRWTLFNPDGPGLLRELEARRLTRNFDFDGTGQFTDMLRDQIGGKNDSWAVRWMASCFLRDRLILYPGRTLVDNIGTDGSGEHFKTTSNRYKAPMSATPIRLEKIAPTEDPVARAAFRDYFHRSNSPSAQAIAAAKFFGKEFLDRVFMRRKEPLA